MATASVPTIPEVPVNTYEELKKKCQERVEEMGQLIVAIEQIQNSYHYNNNLLIEGRLSTAEDVQKAQQYLVLAKTALNDRWGRVTTLVNEISQNFTNASQWIRGQNAVVEQALVEWKTHKLHHLQGGPSDNLVKKYEDLKNLVSETEDLALVLQRQIERYALVLEDLIKMNPNDQQFVVRCRQLINECQIRLVETRKDLPPLVQRGMIVFEEPPSILRKGAENPNKKKGTKMTFEAEIRLLFGEKTGMIRENLELDVILVSEQQALDIVEKRIIPDRDAIVPVGRVSFPKCTLKTSDTDGLVAKVVEARVSNVERATEDDASKALYHLLFRIKHKRLANNNGPTFLPFWALSLPFSVVINANRQEKYKRALMFWRWAFDIDPRTSLSVATRRADKVLWPEFFAALSTWFKRISHLETKQSFIMQRGLEEHEAYLKSKMNPKPDNVVTWDMFYKKKVGESPTFWEWLYPIKEYVAKYPTYWESGLILGFGSRAAVEELLSQAAEPSLILKFSDSRPGKIVASYINWTPNQVMEHVLFDEDDDEVFANKSPAECVRLSEKLLCMSKILPSGKNIADFYALEVASEKKNAKRHDGYVKPGVVFVWGEQPVAPTYTSNPSPAESVESRTNFRGSDDGSNQPGGPASIYKSNQDFPAYSNFLNSLPVGDPFRQDSSSSLQTRSSFSNSFSPEATLYSVEDSQLYGHSPAGVVSPTYQPETSMPVSQSPWPYYIEGTQIQYEQPYQQGECTYAVLGNPPPNANVGMPSNFVTDPQQLPQQVNNLNLNSHAQGQNMDIDRTLDNLQELATGALQNQYWRPA